MKLIEDGNSTYRHLCAFHITVALVDFVVPNVTDDIKENNNSNNIKK